MFIDDDMLDITNTNGTTLASNTNVSTISMSNRTINDGGVGTPIAQFTNPATQANSAPVAVGYADSIIGSTVSRNNTPASMYGAQTTLSYGAIGGANDTSTTVSPTATPSQQSNFLESTQARQIFTANLAPANTSSILI